MLRKSEHLLAEYQHNVSRLSENELNLFNKIARGRPRAYLGTCCNVLRIVASIYQKYTKPSRFKSFGNFYNQVVKFKSTRIFDTFLEKYSLTADQAQTLQGDLDNISKFNQLSQVEKVELEFSNEESAQRGSEN